jgi:predicted permease
MRFIRIFIQRIRSVVRRSRAEEDLRREIDLHIAQLTKEYKAAGMSESGARIAAMREFGPVEATKEQCREMRRVGFVENLWTDLAFALRLLKRSPGFTLTAVLSLALGIGATTAIFSLVDIVLLRMLPVREPQQLVEITRPGGGAVSYPFFEAIRDRNQVFSGVMLLSAGRYTAGVRIGGVDLDIHLSPVSGSYFQVLGVMPVIGRMLVEEDMASSNAAVIGYGFWQRAYAGDPAVLGKTLRVGADGRAYTIVGVAARTFTGVATGQPVDLWLPVTPSRNPAALMFRVIARRKPGIPESTASANVQMLARQLSSEWRFEGPMQIELKAASSGLTQMQRRFMRPLLVLMLVSTLLLLMVALNIANLLLARASARRREIGVRLSLGAGRSRLIQQLLTESFVLGGAGSVLGLLLAPQATGFLVRFLSSSIGTLELPLSIDARILSFTVFVSVSVVLLFGMAPALATTRLDLTPMFLGSSRTTAGLERARLGKSLVVAQVGLSCVLLAGAVLFGRSLQALARVDAGFHPEHVLLLSLATTKQAPTGVDRVRLYERAIQRIAAVAGVRSAAMSSESLFSGSTWTEAVRTPGLASQRGADRQSVLLSVSPGYFQTLGIAMLRGRDFNSGDNESSPKAAVVNEAMARYYFGAADPLGRTFRIESTSFPAPLTVTGLVQNAKYSSLKEAPVRIVYLPALQVPGPFGGANIAIRTAGDPEKMADLLFNEARAESPYLRFAGSTTQEHLVDGTIAQDRMLAQLSGFYGLSAAILVCLGLYGLTVYQASRRAAEIGVRIALGAQRRDVVWMVMRDSMALVAYGSALGVCATLLLASLVQGLLFGVHPFDAANLLVTPALLVGIGAIAAYWPAQRAARLDPMTSLRCE